MFTCRKKFLLSFLCAVLLSALLDGCGTTNREPDIRPSVLPSKIESTSELSKNDAVATAAIAGIKPMVTNNGSTTYDEPVSRGREEKVPRTGGNGIAEDKKNKTDKAGINLKNLIICVDAGHQKKASLKKEPIAPGSSVLKVKDPGGASGVLTKIPEHELNLKVSKLLKSRLEELGATVVMTRESSEVDLGNIERAEIANRSSADLFIRIHADGCDNPAVKGVSVLIPGSEYVKDTNMLKQSKDASQSILKSLVDTTGAKSRGIIERNDLTGFNWAKVPVVLVEMGFLSNAEEDKLLNTSEYQKKIADGIANALVSVYSKR